MTAVLADEPGHKPLTPLLLDIIQWKPWQVNHQFEAQPEKQKREAFPGLSALLSVAFSVWPELGLRGSGIWAA